jgi:hypothetical protein
MKIKIYKTITLPVILYGLETWSLTLREEHRLRVFKKKNKVLRTIFGLKMEEGWRRLHNEELHNLYTSPNVITVIKSSKVGWVGHIAGMGEMRNAYNTLVGKPGKRPHRRPRHR